MSISKKSAKSLAVSYHAYLDAVHRRDDDDVALWGSLLLYAMQKTGVAMVDARALRGYIGQAEWRIQQAAKKAAA